MYGVAGLLVEDSAQSLGSFYKGRHLGTFGDVGSFPARPQNNFYGPRGHSCHE